MKKFITMMILIIILFVSCTILVMKSDADYEEVIVEEIQTTIITKETTIKEELTEIWIEPTTEITTEATTVKETTTKKETTTSVKYDTASKYYDVPLSHSDQDFVEEVCDYYGMRSYLIYQIIETESSWDQYQVSSTNDHGLMQLNARWYSSYMDRDDGYNYVLKNFDIYNKKQNILLGIRELAYWKSVCQNREYYDETSFLECYNRGFGYFDNTSKTNYSNRVYSVTVEEEI